MITEKERKLIEFVYHQGEELIEFLKSNGYGEEHKQVSLYVLRGQEFEGTKFDFINASSSYWKDKYKLERIVSKTYNHCTGKAEMRESKY